MIAPQVRQSGCRDAHLAPGVRHETNRAAPRFPRAHARGYSLPPLRGILAAFFLLLAAAVYASETPIPPAPSQFVTDKAGFLSPQTVNDLSRRLEAYEKQTGHQILVYIDQTTGDAPIEDWAVRAFEKWKVGRKGIDDGVVLFIMAQDKKLRFEVGYGLEGEVPDALAGRIINEVIVPRIQSGDRDGAVSAGIDAVASAISGQGLPSPQQQQQRRSARGQARPLTLGQLILYGIVGLVVLAIFITNPSLAVFLLMSIMSGGGRRSGGGGWGGGGGGGGFGGGGGRSGGGGASGSW